MKAFIKNNFMLMIVSFLLAVIVAMGGYFINELGEMKARLWEVEIKNPSIQQQITALDAKVDQCVKGLEDKIEGTQRHLSDKMDTQYQALKDLIQERSQ